MKKILKLLKDENENKERYIYFWVDYKDDNIIKMIIFFKLNYKVI